jgi:hypothetical protein
MRSKRINRICSNCGRSFEKVSSMPLCRECLAELPGYMKIVENANECLAELPGYMKIVENAKASLNFAPRRTCDGPYLGPGL